MRFIISSSSAPLVYVLNIWIFIVLARSDSLSTGTHLLHGKRNALIEEDIAPPGYYGEPSYGTGNPPPYNIPTSKATVISSSHSCKAYPLLLTN